MQVTVLPGFSPKLMRRVYVAEHPLVVLFQFAARIQISGSRKLKDTFKAQALKVRLKPGLELAYYAPAQAGGN